MGRPCSTHGGEEKCIQGFGREPLKERVYCDRPRHRLEGNINMDLKEM